MNIDVDTHLSEQENQPFLATLEAISSELMRVKVTPWLAASGCLCGAELTVDKRYIAHLVPTQHQHVCCGKTLKVVEVHFQEPVRELLLGIFRQLAERIVSTTAPTNRNVRERRHWDPEDPNACREEAIFRYKQCANSCRNTGNPQACRDRCEAQLRQDLDVCAS